MMVPEDPTALRLWLWLSRSVLRRRYGLPLPEAVLVLPQLMTRSVLEVWSVKKNAVSVARFASFAH